MSSAARVLVVDDDETLRLLCRVNLELEGYDVREAATVAEAEAELEERPALVLLDVHLEGEVTTDLLRRIRAERIPVVVVTGSVDVREYESLADAVLTKPYLPANLVELAHKLARVDP